MRVIIINVNVHIYSISSIVWRIRKSLDNVSNPTIYVIHDADAVYPMFIVHFKKT